MKAATTLSLAEQHVTVFSRLKNLIAFLGIMVVTVAGMAVAFSWAAAAVPAEKTAWYIARSAGLIAYGLLWFSVMFGLVLTMGLTKKASAQLASLHEFISLLSLVFTVLHAVALHFDPWLQASWAEIWIPFALGSYRPLAVGLGQVGFYLLTAVIMSFYLRRRIGAKRWRALHYFTFPLYGLVWLHAITAGTDTRHWLVQLVYLASGAIVLFLTTARAILVSNR